MGGQGPEMEDEGYVHCLQKGSYFKDLVFNEDLFGILGPYWVLINLDAVHVVYLKPA